MRHLILIGFPLEMIVFVHGLNLVYQFWIHTEAIDRFPRWFEAVMNTPSHHRVHHATNARYLDANYAGVFIVWDRMFGSFVEETKEDPPHYGIVGNIATFNPLKVAVHGWVTLAKDLAHARSLREFALYLFRPAWLVAGRRPRHEPENQGPLGRIPHCTIAGRIANPVFAVIVRAQIYGGGACAFFSPVLPALWLCLCGPRSLTWRRRWARSVSARCQTNRLFCIR